MPRTRISRSSGRSIISPACMRGASAIATRENSMLIMPAVTIRLVSMPVTRPSLWPSSGSTKPNSPNCASATPARDAARAG